MVDISLIQEEGTQERDGWGRVGLGYPVKPSLPDSIRMFQKLPYC